MDARLRPGTREDTAACGLILFEAFFSTDKRASVDYTAAFPAS